MDLFQVSTHRLGAGRDQRDTLLSLDMRDHARVGFDCEFDLLVAFLEPQPVELCWGGAGHRRELIPLIVAVVDQRGSQMHQAGRLRDVLPVLLTDAELNERRVLDQPRMVSAPKGADVCGGARTLPQRKGNQSDATR